LEKGSNLTYIAGTDCTSIILGKGSVVIDAYIDSFEEYNRYIFISQKPLRSICECSAECSVKYKMRKNSYEACKEAISESKFLNYWIIDKQLDYIYGPLSKEEYDEKTGQLEGFE
jgi:hypothetical protein